MIVTPGIIDVHVHASGGGGELGPYSRTPEAELSQLIDGGVTTLIGLLGTDSVSRTLQNLYTKMRALEQVMQQYSLRAILSDYRSLHRLLTKECIL